MPDGDGLEAVLARFEDGWPAHLSIGEGWHGLVLALDGELSAIDPDYAVHQVKEKYGGLRYYFQASAGTTESDRRRMDEVCDEYERRSYTVCELTGRPGRPVTRGGWVRTLNPDDFPDAPDDFR